MMMVETTQQGSDRINSTPDSTEPQNKLKIDVGKNPVVAENSKEQISTTKDEIVSPIVSEEPTTTGSPADVTGQSGSMNAGGDSNTVYPHNVHAPQAHAYYPGGSENSSGEWDEYPRYVNAEGIELGSPGLYNENPSLVFHTGYGYSPQAPPYGPYSPVTTPLPSVRGDGQLYSPQQYSFTTPYYPQPVSQAELAMPVGIDQQGAFLPDTTNSNNMPFGPRPGYSHQFGPFGGGCFAGNTGNPSFYDSRQGFDGFGSGGPWSDWSKFPDGQRSLTPLSPAASPQPIGALGSFGLNVAPLSAGMVSQQQRPLYGFGSASGSYTRSLQHGGMYHQGTNYGGFSGFGTNGQSWIEMDKGRRRGRGSGSLCSCTDTLDILSEQNRGPRSARPKNQTTENNSSIDSKDGTSTAKTNNERYNRSDFVTEYKDAKFFIIKSYSEDNVHKSIKYGVWASTPNGNKKLDSAYRESKEKEVACPVFLLFSVNASAQFCGVAEMKGPVDFDKSVDYWQQDKWSGQFPVKWHIIKDIPNSQFRHIILENNDNKPVTNSRDTQEVKLEQGLEILNIFKSYKAEVSILDDFDFYEQRQKAMQERRKARQQTSLPVPADEHRNAVPFSGDLVKQMSKSFAHAVRLGESSKEGLATDNGNASSGAKTDDVMASTTTTI